MRRVVILLSLTFTFVSCDYGADQIANIGVCDFYEQAEDSLYILPYATGSYEILQGNCGPITHFGPQRYAYDFDMAIGTELVAAREGTVISIKEDSSDGVSLCSDNNHLRIQHEDETVSEYLHLTKDGALVEIGDTVVQGQLVALSGNTGCTTNNPHLHFVVWQDDWHKWGRGKDSVPITFRNASPSIDWGLQSGESYSVQ